MNTYSTYWFQSWSLPLVSFLVPLYTELPQTSGRIRENLLANCERCTLCTSFHSLLGNFEVLETLFKLHEESPDLHPDLDPQTQDAEGNTVFHVAARVSSKYALKAVELLCAHHVNPNIRNKSLKTALECLAKRTDRRAQFIRNAARNFAPPKPVRKEKKLAEPEGGVRAVDPVVDRNVESGVGAQQKPSTAPSSSAAKTANVSSSLLGPLMLR